MSVNPIPIEAKTVPIEHKRRKGRPTKARKALEHQPNPRVTNATAAATTIATTSNSSAPLDIPDARKRKAPTILETAIPEPASKRSRQQEEPVPKTSPLLRPKRGPGHPRKVCK